MALNRAPAEVLGICLREAHSPEDVSVAIRQSRAFLNAFRRQEQAILTSVLKKCMSIDALRQALCITECPVWVDGDSKDVDNLWDNEEFSETELDDAVWG
ncbi:hypothetical protein VPNG_02497 [Cytospora leucostoma]|uniref:Uncharacterized protein n=1 Tax=Cytospora leucostoma TaxID=1230097 RepID=A0A423XHS0_9PEZI|nr:hypothetical protein VPNG_02497 [Cytospora leucostoma]